MKSVLGSCKVNVINSFKKKQVLEFKPRFLKTPLHKSLWSQSFSLEDCVRLMFYHLLAVNNFPPDFIMKIFKHRNSPKNCISKSHQSVASHFTGEPLILYLPSPKFVHHPEPPPSLRNPPLCFLKGSSSQQWLSNINKHQNQRAH